MIKTLLLMFTVSACVLVARPADLVPEPYCQPVNQDVLLCRDGHRGDLWKCTFRGYWRCARV